MLTAGLLRRWIRNGIKGNADSCPWIMQWFRGVPEVRGEDNKPSCLWNEVVFSGCMADGILFHRWYTKVEFPLVVW